MLVLPNVLITQANEPSPTTTLKPEQNKDERIEEVDHEYVAYMFYPGRQPIGKIIM